MQPTTKTSGNRKAFLLSKLLPKKIYYKLIRDKISLPEAVDGKLSVKLAETEEEYYHAFRILHDSYVDSGFMSPTPTGLRVTKYHALSTTYVLVVKYESKVVGTCSVVVNGEFGMPVCEISESNCLIPGNIKEAEISAHAIDKQFRRGAHKALFLLLKGIWQLCTYLDLKTMYAVVNPKHLPLFEGILLLDKVSKELTRSYKFVEGAAAVILKGDMQALESKFRKTYGKKADNKNLYRFLHVPEKGGMEISSIKISAHQIQKHLVEWDIYNTFFIQTGVHGSLNIKEQNVLDKHFSLFRIAV